MKILCTGKVKFNIGIQGQIYRVCPFLYTKIAFLYGERENSIRIFITGGNTMTLEKLKKLLADGAITQEEFDELAKNVKDTSAPEDDPEPKSDGGEPPKNDIDVPTKACQSSKNVI